MGSYTLEHLESWSWPAHTTSVSVCVVASICVALLLDGGIILYGCLVWAEDSSPASYTVAVLTFAVCFSLPVVLIGVFLVYTRCHRRCYRNATPEKLELLPANFLQSLDLEDWRCSQDPLFRAGSWFWSQERGQQEGYTTDNHSAR